MNTNLRNSAKALAALTVVAMAAPVAAIGPNNWCAVLGVSHPKLTAALKGVVKPSGGPENGGLEAHMWAVTVDRNGVVCEVTYSGDHIKDQWGVSRVIGAQKANTAANLSVNQAPNSSGIAGLALSTANLHEAVQPGGSLYGLQHSNPVNPDVAYNGPESLWGSKSDPMKGKNIGGINVFGGGLALYNANGDVVGAVGVSGDTSCADHNVAWRLRDALGFPRPAGVSPPPESHDGIIYPTALGGDDSSAFNHPGCLATEHEVWKTIK